MTIDCLFYNPNHFFSLSTNLKEGVSAISTNPEKTRTKIIEANLASNDAFLYRIKFNSHSQPVKDLKISNWELLKLSVYQSYEEKTLWKAIAYSVGAIAVSLLVVGISYAFYLALKQSYADIGKLFNINHYKDGILLYTSYGVEWTARSFINDCLSVASAWPILSGIGTLGVYKLYSDNPIIKNFNANKDFLQKNPLVSLEKVESSVGQFDLTNLGNDSTDEQEKFYDPISQDLIDEKDIRAPKFLLFSKIAIKNDQALKSMFRWPNKCNCYIEQEKTLDFWKTALETELKEIALKSSVIYNPLTNTPLTKQEQEKFLEDISNLFNIDDKQKILDCWSISTDKLKEVLNEFIDDTNYRNRISQMSSANQTKRNDFFSKQINSNHASKKISSPYTRVSSSPPTYNPTH